MYDLRDFDIMFADPVRTRAYLDAIACAVRPGDVVVEIGTGTGYFAVAAARAGARKVYAIELGAVAEVAREVVAANGCAAIVDVLHGDAADIALPERGDVLLEDIRGVLPTFGRRVAVLADARARHLTPGARFVARRDTLFAAPCVAPVPLAHERLADALGDAPHGIDRTPVARRLRDAWRRVRLEAGDLLAAPVEIATMDLATVTAPGVEGRAEFTVSREARLEGIAVWFDAELFGDVRMPNAPAAPRTLYGQALFPLTRAADVRAGDTIHFEWRAHFVAGNYVFAWNTRIVPVRGGDGVAFRQSTLAEALLSAEAIDRRGDHGSAVGVGDRAGGGPHS